MSDSSKDRANLCAFTFADGRRCALPQSSDGVGLCYFHARRFLRQTRARTAAQQISRLLDNDITTACDLNAAFNAVFTATAMGYIKPQAAATLAQMGRLMVQTQRTAKDEFLDTFPSTAWPTVVCEAPALNIYHPRPIPASQEERESALRHSETRIPPKPLAIPDDTDEEVEASAETDANTDVDQMNKPDDLENQNEILADILETDPDSHDPEPAPGVNGQAQAAAAAHANAPCSAHASARASYRRRRAWRRH